MAKAVGLSRALKTDWLNKTVELVLDGKSKKEISTELTEYLSYEIKDATNLNKTRNILLNIWVNEATEEISNIRKIALSAYNNSNSERIALHWCMLLLTYPVFVEISGIIGKITSMQDSFSGAWLKEKLFEEWGERTTLFYALEKILQTMKQINVIEAKGKGNFAVKQIVINDDDIKLVIVKTILALNLRPYYELSAFVSIPQLFPFKFELSSEFFYASDNFEFSTFGGERVIIS